MFNQNNFTTTNQKKISLNELPSLFMIKTIFIGTFKKIKKMLKIKQK